MKTKIKNFETVLYGADDKKNWSTIHYATLLPKDDWKTYLDMDSALDYYLAREFTKDNDADFYRSNFFYTNNVDPIVDRQVLHGPDLGLRPQCRSQAGRRHERRRCRRAGGPGATALRPTTRTRSTGSLASPRTRGSWRR